jgi:hypothetical protein
MRVARTSERQDRRTHLLAAASDVVVCAESSSWRCAGPRTRGWGGALSQAGSYDRGGRGAAARQRVQCRDTAPARSVRALGTL